MVQQTFELKLKSGKVVQWEGTSGEDAAKRYVESFPNEIVVATRYPKFDIKVGMIKIVD